MERQTIIAHFAKLGILFSTLAENQPWPGYAIGVTEEEYTALQVVINKEHIYNPWFTKGSLRFALKELAHMVDKKTLENWTNDYPFASRPKRVAIIMAGNIPMVGFHDLLAVVLSGNTAVCKLSSGDMRLLPAFASVLFNWDPEFKHHLEIVAGPLKTMDAVIATGSNNSAGYFDSYFGKYPHIFRKNRTSVAILDGTETTEELKALGEDMFRYFGLGCRNVSKIFLPESFNVDLLFQAVVDFGDIVNHHKYANNYDYNRTIYLMNSIPFLDNNFCIFKEDDGLFSPLSVFFTQRYKEVSEVSLFLETHKDEIQTVVGHGYEAFGKAQKPEIDDYADGINTLQWLSEL